MEKTEFKVKVIYGNWEELNDYKQNGVIGEYSMLSEHSFQSEKIMNAFILGTNDMGGYTKYNVVERKTENGKVKAKLIFGTYEVECYEKNNELHEDVITEFNFESFPEYSAFITGLAIAVTFSYAEVIEQKIVTKKLNYLEIKNNFLIFV